MIDNYPVRQLPDGTWQEQVNGQWFDWNDRPLCECTVADTGGPEDGPCLEIVAVNLDCPRHKHEFVPVDEHPAFQPYLGARS